MVLKTILMAIAGFSSGVMVAGGIFALIVGLKIIPRFADFTHTAHHMMLYENCIVWGGILGNIVNVYDLPVRTGFIGLVVFGFVGGIYVGAWAMALAEIVDTIPIFTRRVSLKRGFRLMIYMMAVGRTIGGMIHFYFRW